MTCGKWKYLEARANFDDIKLTLGEQFKLAQDRWLGFKLAQGSG